MGRTLTALAVAATACGEGGPPAASGLRVVDAVMPAPVGAAAAAVYFRLVNDGATADTLVAVATPVAARAGLHATRPHGGMLRMEPVPELPVGPGERIAFAPGALHVMLETLTAVPVPGDTVALTLTFRRAGPVTVRVPVVSYADLERVMGIGDPGSGNGR